MEGRKDAVCRIPLGDYGRGARPSAPGTTEQLVARFVYATSGLSCQAAAELAGVRQETLRKWQRSPPGWIKTSTATRLRAYLTGEQAGTAEEGFRRAFTRSLRSAPGVE